MLILLFDLLETLPPLCPLAHLPKVHGIMLLKGEMLIKMKMLGIVNLKLPQQKQNVRRWEEQIPRKISRLQQIGHIAKECLWKERSIRTPHPPHAICGTYRSEMLDDDGKNKFKRKCHYCSKLGHIAKDCLQK